MAEGVDNLLTSVDQLGLDDHALGELVGAVHKGDLIAAQAAVANSSSVHSLELACSCSSMLLQIACLEGHLDVAQWLHSMGAPLNATKSRGAGWTPLHQACFNGHLDVAQWLHSVGAPLNSTDSSPNGEAPLHQACSGGHLEMAQWLISAGADRAAKTKSGSTPAQLLQLHARTAQLDEQALRSTLVSLGLAAVADGRVNPLTYPETVLPEPLVDAAFGGDARTVTAWLDEGGGLDAGSAEHDGGSLLMFAAVGGQDAMVRMLMERGASVNLQDSLGGTALMHAAANGPASVEDRTSIVQALLDAKADASLQTKNGCTALMWAEQRKHTAIVQLLRQHAKRQEASPAQAAMMRRHVEVRFLVQRPELNGRKGVVAGATNGGRCPVLLDGESKPLSLRAACLVPLPTPAEEPPAMCCLRRGSRDEALIDGCIPAGTPFVALPTAVVQWGASSAEFQSLLKLLVDVGNAQTLKQRQRLHALDGLRVLLDGDNVATVCGFDAASKNLDIVLDSEPVVVRRVKPARLTRHVEIPPVVKSKEKVCLTCGRAADGEIILKKCGGCVEAKVAEPAYFCGEACQKLAWPTHKKEHEQQSGAAGFQSMLKSADAPTDESSRQLAEVAGQQSVLGDCMRAHESQDWRRLAKSARKLISQDPGGYFGYLMLTHALAASNDMAGAAEASLLSLERLVHEQPAESLLASTQIDTIELLMNDQSKDVQKPPWWNDAELLTMTKNALAVALRNRSRREQMCAWRMRGVVLGGLREGGPALPPELSRLAYMARLREAKAAFDHTAKIATDCGLVAIDEELKPLQDAVAARLAKLEAS